MDKPISVITCTIRENKLDNVIDNYQRQTYPNKELIIIINEDNIDIRKYIERTKHDKSIRIYKIYEDISIGECLNMATFNAQYNYLTKFDDDDYYAPNHLQDIMEGFEESKAKLLGKQCLMIYFEGLRKLFKLYGRTHKFTHKVSGSTISWTKELWNEVKFRDVRRGFDTQFCADCYHRGIESYAIGCSNHLVIRSKDKENHTWTQSDELVMSWGGKTILDNATLEMAISKIIR